MSACAATAAATVWQRSGGASARARHWLHVRLGPAGAGEAVRILEVAAADPPGCRCIACAVAAAVEATAQRWTPRPGRRRQAPGPAGAPHQHAHTRVDSVDSRVDSRVCSRRPIVRPRPLPSRRASAGWTAGQRGPPASTTTARRVGAPAAGSAPGGRHREEAPMPAHAPTPHPGRGSPPIDPAVRELLAAVRDALAIPHAATVGDAPARQELLETRAMHATIALDNALRDQPGDLAFEAAYLRERLAACPPTTYQHWPPSYEWSAAGPASAGSGSGVDAGGAVGRRR